VSDCRCVGILRVGRRAVFLVFAGTLLALAGCQPPLTEVSGTIKVKGQPPKMKGIEIHFMGADGQVASAPISEDGTYSTKEVRSGEAKVYFVYVDPALVGSGVGKGRLVKPGSKDAPPKGSSDPDAKNPIPLGMRDATTSNLTTKLLAGQMNVFDHNLKEEPGGVPPVPK
jgi:hypothetical protein